MAHELDPALFQCEVHARLAVAFGQRHDPHHVERPWFPWCQADLDLYEGRDNYHYVRFRDDPDDPARVRGTSSDQPEHICVHDDPASIVGPDCL